MKNAAAARAAGMSYGKYVAMRYEQQCREAEEERKRVEALKARRAAEKKAQEERLAREPLKKGARICLECGKEFMPLRCQTICSDECRRVRQLRRMREYNQMMKVERHKKRAASRRTGKDENE